MHMISTAVPNVFHLRISLQIPCVYSNKGEGESSGSTGLIDNKLISDFLFNFFYIAPRESCAIELRNELMAGEETDYCEGV